jgi:TRAP-type C4-dicarboxylate transport system permease small subunit
MNTNSSFSQRLSRWLANLCGALIAMLVLVILADVASRNLLGRSITSAAEVAVLIQLYVVFIAAAVAFQRGLHFVIFSVDHYPPKVGRALALLVRGIIVAFSATLAYYGVKLSLGQWTQLSASLQIPYSFFYFALPVGCVVTIVFALLEPLDIGLANELVHTQERAKKVVT